ncbi:MAG: IS1595 family transposase [Pedobacter sp.]|uniref:IS1595 family transposase n=1 Tax=Pedobacter sp. TaxID=1411316 RepID=UPI002806CA1D|nr:IS1595 family transposase [Pedobacter sp.]MDQ8004025.1 IS1595 family transposase [Pedobacter sp.]
MATQFKNLIQVLDFFKEETTCKEYLAAMRWGTEPACPHCGTVGAYVTNRGYKCKSKECAKKFTVTTGTVFENTKISLRYWFAAMYLCTAHKKGISSLQLSRDLNVTQKTAWFLLHRIREMLKQNNDKKLNGVVEVDETYVGGKNINRHEAKKLKGTHGGSGKTMVVGAVERDGNIKTFIVPCADANVLEAVMVDAIDERATLVSDGWAGYKGVSKHVSKHVSVKHGRGTKKYITYGDAHTNNIEGFWSHLKRGIVGIYHYVSPKHLHRYCDEFAFRYNTRKIEDVVRFDDAIRLCDNKRLRYSDLIS